MVTTRLQSVSRESDCLKRDLKHFVTGCSNSNHHVASHTCTATIAASNKKENMNKQEYTITVYTENQIGLLNRIAIFFREER